MHFDSRSWNSSPCGCSSRGISCSTAASQVFSRWRFAPAWIAKQKNSSVKNSSPGCDVWACRPPKRRKKRQSGMAPCCKSILVRHSSCGKCVVSIPMAIRKATPLLGWWWLRLEQSGISFCIISHMLDGALRLVACFSLQEFSYSSKASSSGVAPSLLTASTETLAWRNRSKRSFRPSLMARKSTFSPFWLRWLTLLPALIR